MLELASGPTANVTRPRAATTCSASLLKSVVSFLSNARVSHSTVLDHAVQAVKLEGHGQFTVQFKICECVAWLCIGT